MEYLEILKEVFGDNTMLLSRVAECHKRFSEGRTEVENDGHPANL